MFAFKAALMSLLAASFLAGAPPEVKTPNERLVELADVLGNNSDHPPAHKVKAIEEVAAMRKVSSLGAGMLFDRANIRFEPDAKVREAAALAIRHVCDTQNRMSALRLTHVADPTKEPEPAVRIAALRSLAFFETGEAASCIHASATEKKEPDKAVRKVAQELIEKGLAGTPY